jgi:hypothetical protein
MPFGDRDFSDNPFTGPFLKALQFQQLKEDIDFRREQRNMARTQYLLDLEERTRQRAMEDLKTVVLLDEMGALPIEEGVAGDFRAGMQGRKGRVQTPIGRYSLPTPEQQFEQKARKARTTGVLKGIEKEGEESITDPYEDIGVPEDLGIGPTVRVQKKNKLEAALKIQQALERRHPNLQISHSDNDQGDRTYFGTNPRTGEVKELRTIPGVARTRSQRERDSDYEAQVLAQGDRAGERMRRIEEWMPWAYSRIGIDANAALPEERLRAQQLAEEVVDKAMRLELDQKVARAKVADQGPTSKSAVQTLRGRKLKQAKLKDAAGSMGMTPDEFAAWFTRQGGEVIP